MLASARQCSERCSPRSRSPLDYTAPVGAATNDLPTWFTRIPVVGSLPETIAIVTWRPSSLSETLIVHGPWIVTGLLFTIWAVQTSDRLHEMLTRNVSVAIPIALIVSAIGIAWSPALLLVGTPCFAALAIAGLDERRSVSLTGGLFATGFGLALIPEFFYIQDSFGSRMNTVFKLNFQAWQFLGVASAAAAVIVVSQSNGLSRHIAAAAVGLVVLATAPYAVLSARDWMDMGVASGTLDGAAYLRATNPGEAAAISWLDGALDPGDVIVEAPGCAYQSLAGVPMNRFSAFTGAPTLLGWANHERQWRRGEFSDLTAVMSARDQLARGWLDGQPNQTADAPVPRFIIFGAVERSTSERCPDLVARGPAEIEALTGLGWAVAYESDRTTILAVRDDPVFQVGN